MKYRVKIKNPVIGVPLTAIDKLIPEQFEILWQACGNTKVCAPKEILETVNYKIHPEDRGGCSILNGKRTYTRLLIRWNTEAMPAIDEDGVILYGE